MKTSLPIVAILLATLSATVSAAPADRPTPRSADVIVDVMLVRPLGLIGTVAGTALLLGFSPFIAMAQVAPPHDAFARAADVFVATPACFTFARPLGYAFSGQDSVQKEQSRFCSG